MEGLYRQQSICEMLRELISLQAEIKSAHPDIEITHGDVKPGNVMFNKKGKIVYVDLGSLREVDRTTGNIKTERIGVYNRRNKSDRDILQAALNAYIFRFLSLHDKLIGILEYVDPVLGKKEDIKELNDKIFNIVGYSTYNSLSHDQQEKYDRLFKELTTIWFDVYKYLNDGKNNDTIISIVEEIKKYVDKNCSLRKTGPITPAYGVEVEGGYRKTKKPSRSRRAKAHLRKITRTHRRRPTHLNVVRRTQRARPQR